MKVALAQLNYHIANFEANISGMVLAIKRAIHEKADLVVFSELSLCGYPPQDLLEQEDFIQQTEEGIQQIAMECKGIAAIIGAPIVNQSRNGKKLYNAAIFIENQQVTFIQRKTHLPTYDVFDEYRYFERNTEFEIVLYKGKKIALSICEDLWDNQPIENSFARDTLYTISPIEQLARHKPDLLINIAASPFSYNQKENRKNILIQNSRQYHLPIIYVNQIGANTELIFDGGSLVVNQNAKIVCQLNYFKEDFRIIDLNDLDELPAEELPMDKMESIYHALVLGIRDYFKKSGFTKATLGLSGGIDSALTLALASVALGPENLDVLLLPSEFSSDHSIQDAIELANNLKVNYHIVPISDSYEAIQSAMSPLFQNLSFNLTEENMQARIRGTLLMAFSNKFGHILLNTSNKSEAAVGYGTLYGDMNGGLSVLGDVYKTDVFALARFINRNGEIIPENTITKPPSAELRPDQKDSDSLPEYDVLDQILYQYIELKKPLVDIIESGFPESIVKKVIQLVNRSEYKRFQAPPILRISSKAFGFGRRYPIVANY
jgi:NAD+ synthase (glutamine-hydrolysing)